MEQVMWAASGSEAIQKAIWAAMARDRTRPMIVATRFGFHGKKGLANAVTGSETDAERDPRVRFITFPTTECHDVSVRDQAFDPAPYKKELDALLHQFGRKIGTLITPLPRRNPWTVARQAATLDHLSGGRVILGVGIGGDWFGDYSSFGDAPDDKTRGEMLDEALAVIRKFGR